MTTSTCHRIFLSVRPFKIKNKSKILSNRNSMLSNLGIDVKNFVNFDDNNTDNDDTNESWCELGIT